MKLSTFIIGILLMVLANSCSHTTYLQVMQPAEIDIPQHIKKVGLINRSFPSKQDNETTFWNILEGVATGEQIRMDYDASFDCVEELRRTLSAGDRFQAWVFESPDGGTGREVMSPPLTWEKVEKMCKDNQVDAIVALEVFDSDSYTNTKEGTRDVKGKDGVVTKVPEFLVTGNTKIITKWRVYDIANKRIIDMASNNDTKSFTGRGATPQMALEQLPNKRLMTSQTGAYVGSLYGRRISPNWITVGRNIYTKAKRDPNMKLAGKAAKVGNWQKAIEKWNKLSNSSNPKIASRAGYNMAVACEVEGKLDLAIDWAHKTFTKYSFVPARDYENILQQRKRDNERLNEQMGNSPTQK